MYSTHNELKSVVAERFIRTLKTKIYKFMTSLSKNDYIDKLHDIVNVYNNTYHITIKMKPVDVIYWLMIYWQICMLMLHILILKKMLMIKILI